MTGHPPSPLPQRFKGKGKARQCHEAAGTTKPWKTDEDAAGSEWPGAGAGRVPRSRGWVGESDPLGGEEGTQAGH